MRAKQILLQTQKELEIEDMIIDIINDIENGVRVDNLEVIEVIRDPIIKYKKKVIFSYE